MAGSVPRTMAVYCDETGAHDCAYFAWGSIWMADDRLGEFNAKIDAIARKHRVKGEFGWKGWSSPTPFCMEVVRWFFQQRWVCFQALIVRKRDMRIFTSERLRNDTVAYKKLLCTLVAVQAANFDALPGGPRQFRIHVDQVGDKPSVAEQEYRIVAAAIRKRTETSLPPVAKFARVDSRSARGIQLADLLVGAIRAEWEGGGKGVKRVKLRRLIAECLGWENLRATTPKNLKFNIWLHNACQGFAVRPMELKYGQGDPEAALGGNFGFRSGYRSEERSGCRSDGGEKVEVRGKNGLTLTIKRVPGGLEKEKALGRSRKQAKATERGQVNTKKTKAAAPERKETKAEERARAKAKRKAERVRKGKARRAWAKKRARAKARAKAQKAKEKEKAASRKVAKPQKKSREKSK